MKTANTPWLIAAAFVLTTTALIAWKGAENNKTPFLPDQRHDYQQDTTIRNKKSSAKKEYHTGDLDQAMKDLDNAMADVDKNLKIDLGKMDIDIKNAMKEVNTIDFQKIGEEVSKAIKNIDWDGINLEISNAVHEATVHLNEVDMKKVAKEIERAQQQIKSVKIKSDIDLSGLHETIEKSMNAARTGIEKAKKEIGQLKELTGALEKDGLIDRKKGYRIETKNGELFINGEKQSKEVTDKYRKYFNNKDYTLKNDGDNTADL